MSQAARLMAQGQRLMAEQLPATISIDGQSYAAGTSGLRKDRDLVTGGWLDQVEVSFWVAVSAFVAAGKPLPVGRTYVTWEGVQYVAEVTTDPTGATVILRCQSPEA